MRGTHNERPDLDMFARVKQWEWEKWHHRFGLAGEGQADVIERLLQRSPGVVLDVGCGPNGRHVVNLAKLSRFVIAVDKYIEALRRARTDGPMPPNVAFLAGNASGLPLVDGSVDHVLAFGLLTYFVEQYGAALSEFQRVTKRQGLVIVTGSAVHPKLDLLEAASAANLHLIEEKEGFCTVASGQKRYLCIFKTV